jgi:23S rRNA (cytosine1962-C5)-methyltransferase
MNSKLFLKKHEEKRIKLGHLWIFSNEIDKISGEADNGDMIDVFDNKGNFLGTGFFNKNSLISARMLSREGIIDFYSFAKEKINKALELRKIFYDGREAFRLLFSESDFMPGLIIDKYNSTYVLQVYSFGMEKNIGAIVDVLKNEFNAKNVFTKNEPHFRRLEGLPETDEIFIGEKEPETISDGSVQYKIDFTKTQKTGFYFDQSDNRYRIEDFVKDKHVVDAFCNSGGFGLHACKAGAASVTFVDSSSIEIENAKQNYQLNPLTTEAEFVNTEVLEFIIKHLNDNRKYDVIMLDPPPFAKSKKNIPAARKGYEKLNKLAMKIINDDGFLVTSSCSFHLSKDDFLQSIYRGAAKAEKKLQLLYSGGASMDHPQLPAMPETSYLKFTIFKVNNP